MEWHLEENNHMPYEETLTDFYCILLLAFNLYLPGSGSFLPPTLTWPGMIESFARSTR